MWYTFSMELELVNPLLTERLRLNLTQHELAEETGLSRNFIVRAEAAEYATPPKPLINFFAAGSPETAELLKDNYRAYQIEQRRNHYGMLYPDFTSPDEFLSPIDPSYEHPLTFWAKRTVEISPDAPGIRENYPFAPSLYAICRAYCVHHAIMYRWTHDVKTVKAVPKIFLAALFESGYSEELLIALQGAYESHRGSVLGG